MIAVVDGEFVCKTLWQGAGLMKLKAANVTFPYIDPQDGQHVEIWGVVVASIKLLLDGNKLPKSLPIGRSFNRVDVLVCIDPGLSN